MFAMVEILKSKRDTQQDLSLCGYREEFQVGGGAEDRGQRENLPRQIPKLKDQHQDPYT